MSPCLSEPRSSSTAPSRPARSLRAFTLIELLVVISIISVLVSLLLPALAGARAASKQVRELSSAQQLMVAFTLYADANKGFVLPGYPPRRWVDGPMPVYDQSGDRLFNEEAQRFPWRIAPYLDYDFRGLYDDIKLLKDIRAGETEYSQYGIDYRYVVSLFPALGMNVAFVGGNDKQQQFDKLFLKQFGRVYIERLDEAQRPSGLMTFCSARAEIQPLAPNLGRPEGFFRVEPPHFAEAQGRLWDETYDPAAPSPGINSGFISLRHRGRAVVSLMDGHATTKDWTGLNDMRLWADRADRAEWGFKSIR